MLIRDRSFMRTSYSMVRYIVENVLGTLFPKVKRHWLKGSSPVDGFVVAYSNPHSIGKKNASIDLTDFDFLGDVNTVLFKADITQLKSEVKKELASLKKLQKVCYRYFICYIQCCGSGIRCLFGPWIRVFRNGLKSISGIRNEHPGLTLDPGWKNSDPR
jgi:hypothetical protein